MFKIDLIVWKWFLFTIPNFYLSMFKIDLIVWKSYTEEWDKIPSISLK